MGPASQSHLVVFSRAQLKLKRSQSLTHQHSGCTQHVRPGSLGLIEETNKKEKAKPPCDLLLLRRPKPTRGPATPNSSRPSRVWPGHEPSPFLACTPRPARVFRHINPEAKSPVTCRSIAGPRPSRSPRPRTSLLLASLRAPCPLKHSAAARKPSAQVFPADPPSRIPSQPVLLRVGAESPGLQRSGLLLEPYTSPSVMALGNHEHKGPARNILSHSFPAIGEYVQSFPLISFFSRLSALVPSLHPKHHHQKPRLCADHRRRLRADHGRLFLTRFQALRCIGVSYKTEFPHRPLSSPPNFKSSHALNHR